MRGEELAEAAEKAKKFEADVLSGDCAPNFDPLPDDNDGQNTAGGTGKADAASTYVYMFQLFCML